jgi:uncharacterized protein YukE
MAGLNPAVCRAQAEVLENQAQKIKSIRANIDGLVEELKQHWWGPDSKQFAQQWEGTHKSELTKVHTQLQKVVQDVRQNIKQQESASGH